MTLTIEQGIEKMNNGEISQRQLAKEMGIKESTLRANIKKAGYSRNEEKKYVFQPKPETQKNSKKSFRPKQETQKENQPEKNITKNPESNDIINTGNNPTRQEERIVVIMSETVKKVTYEIDENLHFELRMKAFKEKKKVSELVEKAIKNFLEK